MSEGLRVRATRVMSEEIIDFEEQLTDVLVEVHKGLNEIHKLQGASKSARCAYLSSRVERGNQLMKSLFIELKSVPFSVAREHDALLNEFKKQLNQAKRDLDANDEDIVPVGQVAMVRQAMMIKRDAVELDE